MYSQISNFLYIVGGCYWGEYQVRCHLVGWVATLLCNTVQNSFKTQMCTFICTLENTTNGGRL